MDDRWSKSGTGYCWADARTQIPFGCTGTIHVVARDTEDAIELTHEIALERISEIVDAYQEDVSADAVKRIRYKPVGGGKAWRIDIDGYSVGSDHGSYFATKHCGPSPCVWEFNKFKSTLRASH